MQTPVAPPFTLMFRPSLVPAWDVRRAVLLALLNVEQSLGAEEVSRRITYGRPNEDDDNCTRATLSWVMRRKWVKSIPAERKGHPPTYELTPAGATVIDAPDSLFL